MTYIGLHLYIIEKIVGLRLKLKNSLSTSGLFKYLELSCPFVRHLNGTLYNLIEWIHYQDNF